MELAHLFLAETMGCYFVFNDFQNEERYSRNGAMPVLSVFQVSRMSDWSMDV